MRCGVCSTSFNALENLSELAFKSMPARRGSDLAGRLDDRRGAAGQREYRAVRARRARRRARSAAPDGADDEGAPWNFTAMPPTSTACSSSRIRARASNRECANPRADRDDLDSTDEHPILVLDEQDESIEEAESIVPRHIGPSTSEEPARASADSTAPRILIPDEMRRRLAEEAAARDSAAREFETRGIVGRIPVTTLALGCGRRLARPSLRPSRSSTASATTWSRAPASDP